MEVFGIPAGDLLRFSSRSAKSKPIGKSFPVYKIGTIDIGLPRRESKAGRGHKGFIVEGDPSMSIEEAARRRDFTINAISWDPLTGEYVDPVRTAATTSTARFSERSICTRSATTACVSCGRSNSRRGSN